MNKQNIILSSGLFENLDIFTQINENLNPDCDKKYIFFYKSRDIEQMPLLRDIIKATKLPETDYDLLEIPSDKRINMGMLFDNQHGDSFIFFDFEPGELGIPDLFKKYQAFKLREKNILLAEALKVLNFNQESKKMLWSQLKNLLNIK